MNRQAWAIPFITASTLVAAAGALPFASAAHSEVATVPIPKAPSPPCNLPTTNKLIIWHRAPGQLDRAETVDESDLYNCRPKLDELRGAGLGPSGPGYCSKVAWLSDNPAYNTLISPTAPLKKVIYQVGDC
jgi:hypothetical protein